MTLRQSAMRSARPSPGPVRAHDRRARPDPGRYLARRSWPSCSRCRLGSTSRSGLALVDRFARLGRVPVESNRSQAMVPQGGTVLPNRWGTRPGPLACGSPRGLVIMLPGVPVEMRKLLEHEVAPRLADRADRSRDPFARRYEPPACRSRRSPNGSGRSKTSWHRSGWPISPGCRRRRPPPDGVAASARRGRRSAPWRARPAPHGVAGPAVYGEGEADLAAVVLDAAARPGTSCSRWPSRAPEAWWRGA